MGECGYGNKEKAGRPPPAFPSFPQHPLPLIDVYDQRVNDRKLYEQILGIPQPWYVEEVALRLDEGEIEVRVGGSAAVERCPECGTRLPLPREEVKPTASAR